jgi:endonuclease/exonuclease/phosphatase family metal-dependent hydrolase
MNALPDSPTIAALKEHWTLLSPTSPTHPSKRPQKCIDYIFSLTSARKVKVLRGGVPSAVSTASGRKDAGAIDISCASDHLPVYVTVKP